MSQANSEPNKLDNSGKDPTGDPHAAGQADNEPNKSKPTTSSSTQSTHSLTISAAKPLFNKSGSYSLATLNCDVSRFSVPVNRGSAGDAALDDSVDEDILVSGTSCVFARGSTGEMKLPSSSESVPMVMLSVPDGRTVMAIPVSSLNSVTSVPPPSAKNSPNANNLSVDPLDKKKPRGRAPSGQLISIQIPMPSSCASAVIGADSAAEISAISCTDISTTLTSDRAKLGDEITSVKWLRGEEESHQNVESVSHKRASQISVNKHDRRVSEIREYSRDNEIPSSICRATPSSAQPRKSQSSSHKGQSAVPHRERNSTINTKPLDAQTIKLDDECKKLLTWKDGVGVLDGCDGIKFKVDEFGRLQTVDSDDEDENEDLCSKFGLNNSPGTTSLTPSQRNDQYRRHPIASNNGICPSGERLAKKARFDLNARHIRKFSHGSSLLSGGPDDRARRFKSSSTTSIAAARVSIARAHNLYNRPLLGIPSKPSPQHHPHVDREGVLRESNRENDPDMNWTKFIEKLMPLEQLDAVKTSEICQWRPNDVQNFVDSITGCSGNGQLFKEQEICGRSLLLLNQSDLVSVLRIKLGPAIKIYSAIRMVREQLSKPPPGTTE